VAGAISRKGGPEIQRESDVAGFTPTGTAAITGAGRLPCRYVIHAVGPIFAEYEEAEADLLLRSAAESALELAAARDLKSVAFPAISSGIYGFPKDRCASVMIHSVADWLSANPETSVKDVRFVLIDEPAIEAFKEAWRMEFAGALN
jgi:O-acetyl-ADP-ribose deacetylase (regulator of RNase III)